MPRKILGPCSVKTCPNRADCPRHKRTTSQRDYGKKHRAERKAWQDRIDSGERIFCRRCDARIPPFRPDAWDLGHPAPKAPECRACNRGTAGRDRS